MDLREWLFRNRVSQTDLAKQLGVTKQYVHHLCHKKYRASPKLALEIEKFTEGEVKAEELVFFEKYETKEVPHEKTKRLCRSSQAKK